jgi:hypothetical protein
MQVEGPIARKRGMHVGEVLEIPADDEQVEGALVNVDEARDDVSAVRIVDRQSHARRTAVRTGDQPRVEAELTWTQRRDLDERHPALRTLPDPG